ncbi:hypothetical protein [Vibrio harveyi]|uniref:hypothetical protein n=1 Tax=Vibrio harveyi TaxID=669 RepID=UPI002380636D|nr:hypothetical protein [Vibrio harveyi]
MESTKENNVVIQNALNEINDYLSNQREFKGCALALDSSGNIILTKFSEDHNRAINNAKTKEKKNHLKQSKLKFYQKEFDDHAVLKDFQIIDKSELLEKLEYQKQLERAKQAKPSSASLEEDFFDEDDYEELDNEAVTDIEFELDEDVLIVEDSDFDVDVDELIEDSNVEEEESVNLDNVISIIDAATKRTRHFLKRNDWSFYYENGQTTKDKKPTVVYIRPCDEMITDIEEMANTKLFASIKNKLTAFIDRKEVLKIRSTKGKIVSIVSVCSNHKETPTLLSNEDLEVIVRYFNGKENKGLSIENLKVKKSHNRALISGVKIPQIITITSLEEHPKLVDLFNDLDLKEFKETSLIKLFTNFFINNYNEHYGYMGKWFTETDVWGNPNYNRTFRIFTDTLFDLQLNISDITTQGKKAEFDFQRRYCYLVTKIVNEYYKHSLEYDFEDYFSQKDAITREKRKKG